MDLQWVLTGVGGVTHFGCVWISYSTGTLNISYTSDGYLGILTVDRY